MTAPSELEHHTTALLATLGRELGETVDDSRVRAVGRRHFDRLTRDARVLDYIPVLVYRATKNELRV